MNARLDLLAPAAGATSNAGTPAFACCPRYDAGHDPAPSFLGAACDLAERALSATWNAMKEGFAAAAAARR